jgi:PAS domain S-box-containing protein
MSTSRRSNREIVLGTLLGEGAEGAEIGISIYDDDGRYVAVNKYGCDLLGYDLDELLTHDVGDFTKGGIDRTVLLKPDRREGVRLVTRKDGSSVPVAFVVSPTRLANLSFYITVWWELPPDDPRATTAS